MELFDPKKLWTLSPDADDWNALVYNDHTNLENSIYGVLLYPKKGIGKERVEREVKDWLDERPAMSHGNIEISTVKSRGTFWAIVYGIESWYNHFDLQEQFD